MIHMLLGLCGYLAVAFTALTVSTLGIHTSIYYPENAQFYISYLLEIIVRDSGRKKATCRLHNKFLIKNDPGKVMNNYQRPESGPFSSNISIIAHK